MSGWGGAVAANPETMVDVLAQRAHANPDAPLVTFAGATTTTVGEVWASSEEVARTLLSRRTDLRPGDAVVTCIAPGQQLLEVLGGVARAGLVEVPLALDVPAGAAVSMARDSGAVAAVLGRAAVAANPALLELADAARVFLVDDGGPDDEVPGLPRLEELRADTPGPLPRLPSPGDPALVMSTSGTTGRPKGVLLPHFAGVRHARRVSTSMRYAPHDVLYNAFPWNHVNIRHAGLGAALVSGARLVAVPRFSASSFWATCRAEGVTAFNFMGAVAAILLRCPASADDRRHLVTRAYGGPAPAWLADAFRDRFGVRLIEAYACTELGDVTSNTVDDAVPGTAGRPLPEYEVRLVDDRDRPVSDGATGLIAVRPRFPHIRAVGYVGTVEDIADDGWTHTGDRGRFDSGGRLVFEGRHGDVVRRRGENISTWDVEAVVSRLPGVREVAAVGVPSEFTEEDLLLAVVPDDGVTVEAVRDWCGRHLPRHAAPRYVILLDHLPRNAATKVIKGALCTPEITRSADDSEQHGRGGPPPAADVELLPEPTP
jgi:crotonobetaine/carnitine-CoA ligase